MIEVSWHTVAVWVMAKLSNPLWWIGGAVGLVWMMVRYHLAQRVLRLLTWRRCVRFRFESSGAPVVGAKFVVSGRGSAKTDKMGMAWIWIPETDLHSVTVTWEASPTIGAGAAGITNVELVPGKRYVFRGLTLEIDTQ